MNNNRGFKPPQQPSSDMMTFLQKHFFSTTPEGTPAAPTATVSSTPEQIAAAKENAIAKGYERLKNIKHEGVQQHGPELWEKLVNISTQRMNTYMELVESSDSRPSGADTSKATWFGQRVRPAQLHQKFRDLSHLSGEERLHQFQQLWLSATDFRPKMTPKSVAVNRWLAGLIILVMGMVSLGGVTRLTKSGLSMTHWKFTGEGRPKTPAQWEEEFDVYKKSPEWRLHNQDMTVEEFKFIYDMEYGHRTLGRTIGVAFVLPLVYFIARRRLSLSEGFTKALIGTLSLGGVQGLIGWWMVKSGLTEEDNVHKARVSPYRLATHLIIAFTLLVGLTTLKLKAKWGAVETLFDGKVLHKNNNFMGMYTPKKLAHTLSMLSLVTAFSGAFVAGNEAGLVYNEWPKMGEGFIPSDLFSPHMSLLQNTFENPTFVQFTHRCLAYTTFTVSWVTAIKCLTNKQCPGLVAKSALACATVASLQAMLGVATLLNHVPVDLAALHQGGAMVLLMASTRLMFHTNNPVNALGDISGGLAQNKQLFFSVMQNGGLAPQQQQPMMAHAPMAAPNLAGMAAQQAGKVNKSAAGILAAAGVGMIGTSYFQRKQQQLQAQGVFPQQQTQYTSKYYNPNMKI